MFPSGTALCVRLSSQFSAGLKNVRCYDDLKRGGWVRRVVKCAEVNNDSEKRAKL